MDEIKLNGGKPIRQMEANKKVFEQVQSRVTKNLENTARQYGIKEWKKIFDLTHADFSIKKFREGAYAVANKLREAQSELVWGQLLRAGVENTFNDIYMSTPVTYMAVVRETSSNKRQEFYAPVERTGFPKQVPEGGKFPETTFKGLDLEIVNQKSGFITAFDRELIDDDMTGQIVQRASQMGENARIYEDAYVWNRIFDGTLTLDGATLPKTNTYTGSGKLYSTTGIHTGGYGINATTAARLSQAVIIAGWILAAKMTDSSGRPMFVSPNILAVSPDDVFFAETLMNSDVWAVSTSSQTADIGKIGNPGAKNPIKGLAGIVSSRFIPQYGAMFIDPKGFNFQRRDPSEVVQENPTSGPAFSQEVFRYKQRARWEADFIDPKFFINLNRTFSST